METKNSETTQEVVKLEPFQQKVDAMKELVKDYKNLVVTAENLKEMDEKRLVLYRHRIDIQRQEKGNNDALNKAKKLNTARAAELIGILEPVETDLHTKIKAIQDAEALAKKKEEDRVYKHRAAINGFGQRILDVIRIIDIQDLELKKAQCREWRKNYVCEEFESDIDHAMESYLRAVDNHIESLKTKIPAEPIPAEQPSLFDAAVAEESKIPSNIPADQRVMVRQGIMPDVAGSHNVAKEKGVCEHCQGKGYVLVHNEKVLCFVCKSDTMPEMSNSEKKSIAPTMEERAKSGEYSVGVACNLILSGYRFYIDPNLDSSIQNEIRAFIQAKVDSITENEEAF